MPSNEKKSIVILINNLGIGGAERLVVDEFNELRKRKLKVTLITLRESPKRNFENNLSGYPEQFIRVPFRSLYDFTAWGRLYVVLKRIDPDVFITHLWFANTIGRVISVFIRPEKIFSFEHNVYDRVKTKLQFAVDRALQFTNTRIISISQPVTDSLVAHGIKPDRISLIENGLNLLRYVEAKRSNIRAELKIASDTVVFLFVGRLILQKGIDILIESFQKIPDAILLIAGSGNLKDSLEAKVKALGLTEKIYFLGVRDDIPELMKAADCLVLPSRWEGHGLVIPEAMAAGVPVIAADFPAAMGMVSNGKNGILVQKENVNSLRGALTRMSDPVYRGRLAKEVSESANRFSIQRHVDTLLSYVEA